MGIDAEFNGFWQITQKLGWMIRMSSDLETNLVSVERINEYSETPTEVLFITYSSYATHESFLMRFNELINIVQSNFHDVICLFYWY